MILSGIEIFVVIIFPEYFYYKYFYTDEYNKPALKKRPADSHKGTFGKVTLIGGNVIIVVNIIKGR